ncbi:hypothetical protein RchiOBHm_Chr1g0321291 [Rosa chinensis]|uniref:Uncharacterized protein n=1 Tax=Rosa chinensis TaxID=74649 RepID=A0A2P6S910_ROSCH|nr:hypothetical protein RchiOBHm_Chr1g0321291 [Rosa chinensis]
MFRFDNGRIRERYITNAYTLISEVDPIVASFSGGAIGVILALTVVEKYGVS